MISFGSMFATRYFLIRIHLNSLKMNYRYGKHTIYNIEYHCEVFVRSCKYRSRTHSGFCARGYFCVTVGQMTEETIKNYLEHHFEMSPKDNFKPENGESE